MLTERRAKNAITLKSASATIVRVAGFSLLVAFCVIAWSVSHLGGRDATKLARLFDNLSLLLSRVARA